MTRSDKLVGLCKSVTVNNKNCNIGIEFRLRVIYILNQDQKKVGGLFTSEVLLFICLIQVGVQSVSR
jgi:hypothetical protein